MAIPTMPTYDMKTIDLLRRRIRRSSSVATLFDYRVVAESMVRMVYGLGIVLLVLVYFLRREINGAKSWFKLPGGSLFQPAEMMKIF